MLYSNLECMKFHTYLVELDCEPFHSMCTYTSMYIFRRNVEGIQYDIVELYYKYNLIFI